MIGIASHPLPIQFLAANQCGRIVDLAGETSQCHRLEEMGLRHGTIVRVVKSGCPCVLAVENRRISLRLDGTADVLVEVTE